jgi:DNA polymerase III subunit gamma/tau
LSRSALYREYRPTDLSEVVGQEHITSLLESALQNQRLSHAYLFCGPRGTGKTSVARILARRVNDLPNETKLESELDVMEIDAASNRGIDEIRALREKIATAPTRLKYKVFIIDEAHMLTREAFNALLKTLEEPPAHALFILATTEVHKLPDTVISRTQRYDFRPVQPKNMLKHLRSVAEAESLQVEDDGLMLIAELSGGGFRDALGLIDQLSSSNQKITHQIIAQIAGIGDEPSVKLLIEKAGSGELNEALDLVGKMWQKGVEPTLLTEHILLIARKAFLGSDSKINLTRDQLANLLESFSRAATDLKTCPLPTLPVELAMWRLQNNFTKHNDPPRVSDTKKSHSVPKPKAFSQNISAAKMPAGSLEPTRIAAKALSLIKSKNNSLYAVLRSGNPSLEENKLMVRCRFRFHKERIEETKNRQFIEAVFSKVADHPIELVVEQTAMHEEEKPRADQELVASALEILGGEVVEE